jgi:hypothetical protein
MPDAPQRVCPHCARLSYETGHRCPYCGGSYARRMLPAIALLLAVFAAGILGGVYLMLVGFGDELDQRLNTQVENVQRDLDGQFRGVQRDVRRELDRRLPSPTPAP